MSVSFIYVYLGYGKLPIVFPAGLFSLGLTSSPSGQVTINIAGNLNLKSQITLKRAKSESESTLRLKVPIIFLTWIPLPPGSA